MGITPYTSDSLRYLEKKILEYYELRGLRMPNLKDSGIWLSTEVGELLDAIMRLECGWVRNDPAKNTPALLEKDNTAKLRAVEEEMGDCLMMLLVTAHLIDVDIMNVLLRKMNRKTGGELLAGKMPLNFDVLGEK